MFEGNLKNYCQKAVKTNSSFSCNESNVPMLCSHVIKMNEVLKKIDICILQCKILRF